MEKEIKQCLADIRDFCGDLKSKLVAAIEDTGWKTLNSQIQYRRKNGVVYVVGTSEGSKALTAKQYTTVGTLPVSFKPSIQINGFGVDAYGGTGNDFTSFITTDGEIKIYANNGTTYWRFATSFPAGGGYCIRKIGGVLYEIAHHLKGYIKCIKDTCRNNSIKAKQSMDFNRQYKRYSVIHGVKIYGAGCHNIVRWCKHTYDSTRNMAFIEHAISVCRILQRYNLYSNNSYKCKGQHSAKRIYSDNNSIRQITPRGGVCYG